MTTKIHADTGIEFPDSTVQSSAAYTKAQSDGPAVFASRATNQTVPSTTPTKCDLTDELFDTNICFSAGRFTPNVAGYYQVTGSIWGRGTTMTAIVSEVRKNNIIILSNTSIINYAGDSVVQTSGLIYMNGTTDYLELWGQINAASGMAFGGSYSQTFLSASLARRA